MSEVAEITVQYNNPPKEGKKWGSIKASDGTVYFGPPSTLSQFRAGETCRLEWEEFGEGGKKIKRKIESPHAVVPKQNVRPAAAPRESEQMFVVALLKEYIGAGMVALDTQVVVEAVRKLRAAHAMTFGGTQAQTRDDLDDQIPF